MAFHLGYHSLPIVNVMPGFGHVGLGGSLGWADPGDRGGVLLRAQPAADAVCGDRPCRVRRLCALIRQAAAKARKRGFRPVTEFGAPYSEPGAVAG